MPDLQPFAWIIGGIFLLLLVILGIGVIFAQFFKKVEQGTAIIKTGLGSTKVSFTGLMVYPIIHRYEIMDISVKRIEIDRTQQDGLICKDNIRADIKVAFFVRVNKTDEMVLHVAQILGCRRASDQQALRELFEPKFSEALKTVGKQFDFVELYNSREAFREQIIKVIGNDLNGYTLDDCSIDYLEQTNLDLLDPQNVLDAEGIKKITDLTSQEQIRANYIRREKEKTITQQDVEAREAILELEKQQKEAEEKQQREISEIKSRQRAEAEIVAQQELQRSETARIGAEEEIMIAEENKQRSVIVAEKSKQRTDKVETERVEKDRQLEVTERERVVSLADIDKEKAIEVEKKNIQDVIRERVMVERAVVEEEEKIKDTQEFAAADRSKQVAVTKAKEEAEQHLVKEVQSAEAEKQSATKQAETVVIKAEADRAASEKAADAKKMLADANRVEVASTGLAEAEVLQSKAEAEARGDEAKATALQKVGIAEAMVNQKKHEAEAKGQEALATATQKTGTAEAEVMELKFSADAKGITQKAEAMKLFDGVGREHEEFKIQLNKEKEVELAAIDVQREIAEAQAKLVGEGLKTATIDIVGGDNKFFDSLVGSITAGKQVDRLVGNSEVLGTVKDTFFNGDPDYFKSQIGEFIDLFGVGTEDIKNLTIAGLIGSMMSQTEDPGVIGQLQKLMTSATQLGISDQKGSTLKLGSKK
ncbi:MAG: flotillin family protein [Planctomycetota bacterium]|nr:flotillin family protein [Planctomycetota bacterium]